MSQLKTNLEQILQEKQEKIIPENIKKDVQIFDVVGTLESNVNTSDATATSNDILYPKTAYVNGQKITGGIEATYKVLSNVEGDLDSDPIEYMKYIGNKYVLKINNSGFRVYEIDEDANTLIHLDNETIPTDAQYNNFAVSGITDDNDFRIVFTDKYKTNNLYYYRFDIANKKIINVGTFKVFNNSMYTNNGFKIALSKNGTRIVEFIKQALSDKREVQLGNVSTTGITSNRQLYSQKYGSNTFFVQFLNNDKLINVTFEDGTILNNKQYILNDAYNYSTEYSAQYNETTYKNLIFNSSLTYCYTGNAMYTVKYEDNMYKPNTKVVDVSSELYTFKGFVSDDYVAFNETLYKIANPLQQIQVYNHAIDTGVIDTAYAGINLTNNKYEYTLVLDIDNQSTSIIESLDTKDGVCWNLSDVGTAEDKVLLGYDYGNYNGIRTGTMTNNGELNYTPNTTQQIIPTGYTSGGTVAGDSNLIPENIKKDISIFDVTGTLETGMDTSSDNPITTDDVVQGKEGFVNGEKIIGSLYKYPDTFTVTANHERTSVKLDQDPVMQTPSINISIQESSFIDTVAMDKWKGEDIYVSYDNLVSTIGLTPEKIKAKETILGITGTYQGEGVIDYTGNNFEIINNKYLKFKTINYGVNTDIESLPQFRIPDEMLGVFINNKDNLIINMTKDYNRGSLYKFAVYTTTHTADYLEISCTGTSSSSFQREEVYKLGTGGNFDNPICYAVRPQPDETEINTVIDSTSDFKFNYYEFECDTDTDLYSNFRANTTSSYQDIDVEYLYQAALVGGTNGVESKFYLGTYFTDMNYMNKPASIDNVSMEYKNITDFSVPAMLLNNTQEIHLTSSQLSDTGTAITQDGSWKLTNPEGIITTEIANPTIQSYVRGLNPKGSTSTFSYRMVSDYLGLTYYKNLSYNRDYKLYVDDIEWTGSVDFDVDMKILLVSSSGSEYELYNNSLYSGEYWESSANSISGSNDPTYYWRYACDHIKLVIDVIMNYRP